MLGELLSEDVAVAARRANGHFDSSASPFERRIVIYGAGELGQRILAGLRTLGLDALAFSDRNPALWSRRIADIPVLSPEDAARIHGSAAIFVVSVWHPVQSGGIRNIIDHLNSIGCERVVPFVSLYWKFPRTFLPYFLWDRPEHVLHAAAEIRAAYRLLAGARSQNEFLRQLKLRLTGDFSVLSAPEAGPQYFSRQLFPPREDECFVDCGAYNGDTLLDFAEWTKGRFQKVVAFEADPNNFAALNLTANADTRLRGRVEAFQQAVGSENCTVRFAASGHASAAISASGRIEVQCVSLDQAVMTEHPTYIKMDIEGAELDALQGAREILARDRPALAICAYHFQDHLWRVPQLMRELMPDASLLLRPHCADGFDLVCYAIPPERDCDLAQEDV